jgi:hypothetical protein
MCACVCVCACVCMCVGVWCPCCARLMRTGLLARGEWVFVRRGEPEAARERRATRTELGVDAGRLPGLFGFFVFALCDVLRGGERLLYLSVCRVRERGRGREVGAEKRVEAVPYGPTSRGGLGLSWVVVGGEELRPKRKCQPKPGQTQSCGNFDFFWTGDG